MIPMNEILNDEGKFNEGIYVSPNWLTKDEEDIQWVLFNTETARKELKRIQRLKGRKRISINLGFGEHLSSWVEVGWKHLFELVAHRDSRFANCTFNQIYYIKHTNEYGHRHNITVWPGYIRNENENRDNDWGKALPNLFGGEEE